jgi:integrase/recombinase XerD
MTIRKDRGRSGYLVQVEKFGLRRRKTVDTMAEARRAEHSMRVSLEKDRPFLALDDALRGYEATLRTRAKAATLRSAQYHAGTLEGALGPGCNLAELTQADLDRLVLDLRAKGLRDTSINGALRVLRAAANLAAREARVQPPRITLLRETKKIPTVLTREELAKLLGAAVDPDARLALTLAAHAGLRHQEILHLTWSDVVGEKVRVTAKAGWSPKAHAERTIPMNRVLVDAVNAAHQAALGPLGGPRSPWLFPGANGQPKPSLAAQVREAFKAAELWIAERRPGLHMLRRTWATRLAAKGIPLVTIMRLGGWSSLEVVQRYLDSDTDVERAAVAALED